MKKFVILFIICVIFISGCSSDAGSSDTVFGVVATPGQDFRAHMQRAATVRVTEPAANAAVQTGNGQQAASSPGTAYSFEPANESSPVSQAGAGEQTVRRMIIRNANVNMEVADVEEAYASIITSLERFGGYEANKNLESWGGHTNIWADFRIPAQNLDAFLREIAQAGKVRSQNIYSHDITDQYFDSRTRLETLERTLARYFEFLDNAQNIREQLQITSYISDLTYEIESLKGSLGRWAYLVAYSSVSLSLNRTPELFERREIEWSSLSLDDMGFLITSGFVSVSSFIINMFQLLLIALVAGSPIIVPAALVIFLAIRRVRRKTRERAEPDHEKAELEQPPEA